MKRFALLIFALSALPLSAQIQIGAGGSVNIGNVGGAALPITGGTLTGSLAGTTASFAVVNGVVSPVCAGTDDTAAINAALTTLKAAGGGTLQVPNARCRLTGDIVISPSASGSNITIQGSGPASELYFDPTAPFVAGVNREPLYIVGTFNGGSIASRRRISAAITQGATSFTVTNAGDAADLLPNDWIMIGEYDLGAGDGSGTANAVIFDYAEVASVSGTTVNVTKPFRTAFPNLRTWNSGTLSGLGFYRVPTLLHDITIAGIRITQPAKAQTLPGPYVAYGVKDVTFRDVTVDNANGNAIASFMVKHLTVENFHQIASRNQISEFAATVDLFIHHGYFGQDITTNSPTDAGNPAFAMDIGTAYFVVSDTTLAGSGNGQVSMTTGVHDGVFVSNVLGNYGIGASSAITGRGIQRVTVANNKLLGSTTGNFGIDFAPSSGYTVNIATVGNVISNNSISGFTNPYGAKFVTDFYTIPETVTGYQRNLVPDSNFKMGSPAYWDMTAAGAMAITPAVGGGGGNGLSLAGTGAASGFLIAWSAPIAVTPLSTYTVSAYIDGSFVTVGGPSCDIWKADKSVAYTTGTNQLPGVKGRTWASATIPAGITSVRVMCDSNNATITNAKALIFSSPQLEAGTVVSSYMANELSDVTGAHGTGSKVQFSDGTGTTGHVPLFASDGSLTDSGTTPVNRVVTGYCQGTATASATLSLGGFGGSLANCTTGTAVGAGVVMPTVATIAGLYVRCGTTGVNASSGLFTVYDQPAGSATAAATPITITYGTTAANTLVSDTGHATAVSAGDLITVKFTTQAAETLANCSASVTY